MVPLISRTTPRSSDHQPEQIFLHQELAWLSFLRSSLVGMVVLTALTMTGCRNDKTPRGAGGEVHGLVYAEISDSSAHQNKRRIFVPDINVYLREILTGVKSPNTTTNARGWYAIPHMPAGSYQLCWE